MKLAKGNYIGVLSTVFDLKKQRLCRRISRFIEGRMGRIFHLAAGRVCVMM